MAMLSEKIFWFEGMAVGPQHFQQQDRYVDSQIRMRTLAHVHHGWGFMEFSIDEQYLPLGKVVLNRARGFLPDGTLFEVGQEVLSLDITPGVTNRRVALALPLSPEGASEVRQEGLHGISTPYVAHRIPVRDSVAGSRKEVEVACCRLDLRLMLEEETEVKGFISMPVVQILECKPDRTILLDKDFMPTFLHLSASSALSGYLREIVGLLSHRGDQLALRVSSAGQTGTAEAADFWLLQCINRAEPVFRHLGSAPCLHPEEFYVCLHGLVGELATFAESRKRPAEFMPYDHSAQDAVFSNLMSHARQALSMVLEQHAVELPLQQRKYGILVSPIHDRNLLASAIFVLAVVADMDSEFLRATIPKQLKISSVERIRDMVRLQLPGIKVRVLPVAPRQIPFHAGKTYFKLEISSEELAQLELSGGFALHVSGAFPGIQLQFWAIKE
jgi:type VI secretion system protein ImpJ